MSDVEQSDDYDWVDDPDLTYEQTMERFNQLASGGGAVTGTVVFGENRHLILANAGVPLTSNVAANARG